MSVGIFQNGEYNKVAGNAKDSTAANTTYNNGTSGLQANNVQSAIDEVSAKIGQENISQVGNSVTGAINNLNSNLNTKITAEYVRNLIIAIGIANNNTSNYTIGVNGALFILARNGAIFMVNYQSDKPTMVFGALPSGLTISKSKESSKVTIENKMGYTLNGIIITT